MTVSEREPVSGHLDDVRPGGGDGNDGASSETLLGHVSCLLVDMKHEADDEKVRSSAGGCLYSVVHVV